MKDNAILQIHVTMETTPPNHLEFTFTYDFQSKFYKDRKMCILAIHTNFMWLTPGKHIPNHKQLYSNYVSNIRYNDNENISLPKKHLLQSNSSRFSKGAY